MHTSQKEAPSYALLPICMVSSTDHLSAAGFTVNFLNVGMPWSYLQAFSMLLQAQASSDPSVSRGISVTASPKVVLKTATVRESVIEFPPFQRSKLISNEKYPVISVLIGLASLDESENVVKAAGVW